MSFNKSNEILADEVTVSTSSSGRSNFFKQLEYVASIINQMCIGFITIYMTWLCTRRGLSGTVLHAWLVTIGFHFLMAEAIMCHYGNNVLTFSYKRKTKTTIHWVLQVLGGGCGVAGVIFEIVDHKFRLRSVHAKVGFAAFILCLVSMLSGVVALFSGIVRRILSPLLNKAFHNLVGIAAFVLALVAQYYGYEKRTITSVGTKDFDTLIQVVTLVALVLTCIGPLKALYSKCATMMGYK